jgi:hypothetical protein
MKTTMTQLLWFFPRGSKMRAPTRAGLVFLLAAFGADAAVYLNGVNIDGVTNQRFDKAAVRIDDRGNIFIDAPGYQVKSVDNASGALREGSDRVSRRYWLVTEQSMVGMTEFDVDLFINSKWVRKLKNNEEQIVTEITKYLTPGKNEVTLIARKLPVEKARKSFSKQHVFKVIIGEGNVGGENVMIDNPLVKFERNASETEDVSQEFTITAR